MVLNNNTYPYEEIDKSAVMAYSVEKEYQLRIRESTIRNTVAMGYFAPLCDI